MKIETNERYPELLTRLQEAEKVVIGLGGEWKLADDGRPVRERRLLDAPAQNRLRAAYEALYELVKDKDYYLVTTVTDGAVYDTPFDGKRIVAPCGNIHWRQCSGACTKDIWEEGEVPDGICPHCGEPLIPNTVEAEHYIEEGYLISWREYTQWLGRTLNRRLEVLELGAGMEMRELQVIRWPLEKTVFFNNKAHMYRINGEFPQISDEIGDKARAVRENSVEFVEKL